MQPSFSLDPNELIKLPPQDLAWLEWRTRWAVLRHRHQVPPEGEWTVWALIAGRGAGKTRTAAETLGQWAWRMPGTRWLASGRTTSEMRAICFEGDSGLLACIPPVLVADYNKSLFELRLTNGSMIKGVAAEEPEAFRGFQFHGGWVDELAAWTNMQAAWDMIMFGMRLGEHPKILVTTTPRPKPLIRQIVEGKLAIPTVVTTASSYANIDNLAPTFKAQLLQYEGTKLGRQEIHGEVLDALDDGIISRSWLGLWDQRLALPNFEHIVMSLDTAFTEDTRDSKTGDADYSACSVWGLYRRDKGVGILLLDCWQERLGLPDLVDKVKSELKVRYGGDDAPMITPMWGSPALRDAGRGVDTLIIEDKGSGISLRQVLAREGIMAMAYNPGRADKLARLHAISHLFSHAFVFIPESETRPGQFKTWAEPLVEQVCSFSGKGSIPHDDLLDSTTQALRYLADYARMSATEEMEDPDDVTVDYTKKRGNPYG
jgi:predicted phage terminase large subunit-like protein